jgi:pyruvate ferredoxin oxidoreductase gamma subunit
MPKDHMIEVRWHSRAGQGAMTAGQLLAEVAGNAGKYVQAYPDYGAEKRGAPMCVYNRISDLPIRLRCSVTEPNIVLVLDATVMATLDVTEGLKPGGFVMLNTRRTPEDVRKVIGRDDIHVVTLDASGIARKEIGGDFPNVPMAGAFMRVANFMDCEKFLEEFRRVMLKSKLGAKGERIVTGNLAAARRGYEEANIQ